MRVFQTIGMMIVVFLIGPTAFAKDLKIYISVDMEGIAGAVTGEQLSPSGFEYQRFREFTTLETPLAQQLIHPQKQQWK
jgi:D-amino peptidase